MNFQTYLATGQVGESRIARWFQHRGFSVLPVYEKELHTGKGPRLFTPHGQRIALDMFVFSGSGRQAAWIEAKHKSVFSWHRKTGQWVTGIDLRHYQDYLRIADETPWPVFLLFLHAQDRMDRRDEPWPCPTGLFGGPLQDLRRREHHRDMRWGASGMVYWAHGTLHQYATLAAVDAAVADWLRGQRP